MHIELSRDEIAQVIRHHLGTPMVPADDVQEAVGLLADQLLDQSRCLLEERPETAFGRRLSRWRRRLLAGRDWCEPLPDDDAQRSPTRLYVRLARRVRDRAIAPVSVSSVSSCSNSPCPKNNPGKES